MANIIGSKWFQKSRINDIAGISGTHHLQDLSFNRNRAYDILYNIGPTFSLGLTFHCNRVQASAPTSTFYYTRKWTGTGYRNGWDLESWYGNLTFGYADSTQKVYSLENTGINYFKPGNSYDLLFVSDQDNNKLKAYVNGNLYSETDVSTFADYLQPEVDTIMTVSSFTNDIGLYNSWSNYMIFNRALNEDEARYISVNGGVPKPSTHENIIAHWPLQSACKVDSSVFTFDSVEQYNYAKPIGVDTPGLYLGAISNQTISADGDYLEFTTVAGRYMYPGLVSNGILTSDRSELEYAAWLDSNPARLDGIRTFGASIDTGYWGEYGSVYRFQIDNTALNLYVDSSLKTTFVADTLGKVFYPNIVFLTADCELSDVNINGADIVFFASNNLYTNGGTVIRSSQLKANNATFIGYTDDELGLGELTSKLTTIKNFYEKNNYRYYWSNYLNRDAIISKHIYYATENATETFNGDSTWIIYGARNERESLNQSGDGESLFYTDYFKIAFRYDDVIRTLLINTVATYYNALLDPKWNVNYTRTYYRPWIIIISLDSSTLELTTRFTFQNSGDYYEDKKTVVEMPKAGTGYIGLNPISNGGHFTSKFMYKNALLSDSEIKSLLDFENPDISPIYDWNFGNKMDVSLYDMGNGNTNLNLYLYGSGYINNIDDLDGILLHPTIFDANSGITPREKSLNFNGTSHYLRVPNFNPTSELGYTYIIAAQNNVTDNGTIFDKRATGKYKYVGFSTSNTDPMDFRISQDNGGDGAGARGIKLDNIIYDRLNVYTIIENKGLSIDRYMNGYTDFNEGWISGGFHYQGFDDLTNDLNIGRTNVGSIYLNGSIAYLLIIKGILSQEEILELSNNTLLRNPYIQLQNKYSIELFIDFNNPFQTDSSLYFRDLSPNEHTIEAMGYQNLQDLQNNLIPLCELKYPEYTPIALEDIWGDELYQPIVTENDDYIKVP